MRSSRIRGPASWTPWAWATTPLHARFPKLVYATTAVLATAHRPKSPYAIASLHVVAHAFGGVMAHHRPDKERRLKVGPGIGRPYARHPVRGRHRLGDPSRPPDRQGCSSTSPWFRLRVTARLCRGSRTNRPRRRRAGPEGQPSTPVLCPFGPWFPAKAGHVTLAAPPVIAAGRFGASVPPDPGKPPPSWWQRPRRFAPRRCAGGRCSPIRPRSLPGGVGLQHRHTKQELAKATSAAMCRSVPGQRRGAATSDAAPDPGPTTPTARDMLASASSRPRHETRIAGVGHQESETPARVRHARPCWSEHTERVSSNHRLPPLTSPGWGGGGLADRS